MNLEITTKLFCYDCNYELEVKMINEMGDDGKIKIRIYPVTCPKCLELSNIQGQSAGMKKAKEILLKPVEA